MALRTSPSIERPDHTRLQAGSEGSEFLQSGQKIVTRGGAIAAEADFDINSYDLAASGDFDLHTEKSGSISGSYPDTGGAGEMTVFIESSDDAQFSVEVEWINDSDNVIARLDNNIDADLQSTSPAGGNHFVFVTISPASDKWNIIVTDDSGGAQNNTDGSINVH